MFTTTKENQNLFADFLVRILSPEISLQGSTTNEVYWGWGLSRSGNIFVE
jgi:hypothetical protein